MNQTTSKPDAPMAHTLHEVKPNSFIFEKHDALPAATCAEIVQRFEDAKDEHYVGRTGYRAQPNESLKRSTDLYISGKEHWRDVDQWLFQSLAQSLSELSIDLPYFRGQFKDEGYGIQRTEVGEFYHWHVDGDSRDFGDRQLVAIWYLNDVDGPGGETEFLFQDVKVKPEVGKLVLFPPFWTHQHRGVTLEAGVKYIATTWIVFQ